MLLQTHYHQLVSTPTARPVLTDLKEKLYPRTKVILEATLSRVYS